MLCGWWAALYISSMANIRWPSLPVIYVLGSALGAFLSTHSLCEAGILADMYLPKAQWSPNFALGWGVMFSTPLIVHECVRWAIGRVFG